MDFVYGEAAPARRRELTMHLAACPGCSAQVRAWRRSQRALDDWRLPGAPRAGGSVSWRALLPGDWSVRPALTALKWAAAAALVLALGFGLGRRTAPAEVQTKEIKAALAQLAQDVEREHSFNQSNNLALAAATSAETVRLLAEFSRAQAEQRAGDQQTVKLALETLGARLENYHADLETVAVNTADGFQQTHQNLARLISYSPQQKP